MLAKLLVAPRAFACLLCLLLPALPASGQTSVRFQQGLDGYASAVDLHLSIPADFYGPGQAESQFRTNPLDPHWEWDAEKTYGEGSIRSSTDAIRHGYGDGLGLLRFDDLFGSGPDQIPPGATIVSATLELITDNRQEAYGASVHRVLQPWDDATIWSNFGPEPGPQRGVDFRSDADALIPTPSAGRNILSVAVTESVQAWSDQPSSNHGWLFLPFGARSTIDVTGSAIAQPTAVRVNLEIDSPQRGELVVTLRHGDYSALLLDRIGRFSCTSSSASGGDDLDLTLRDDAAADVHATPSSLSPLTGSYRPDAFCVDLPLCPGGGGLCAGSPDGPWVLTLHDEWSGAGSNARLVSWSIEVLDGVSAPETYGSTTPATVPKRHQGSRNSTRIHSSEALEPTDRPTLIVEYELAEGVATAPADPPPTRAAATAATVEYELRVPPYVQLGAPELGDPGDQRVLAWQTIARRLGGPNDDAFTVEYRREGDTPWTLAPEPTSAPTGSASRLAHSLLLDPLDFATAYEYRVTHLRNGAEIQSWQGRFETRGDERVHFTAFGNSGQGNSNALSVGQLMDRRDADLHLLLGDAVYFHGEYEHLEPRLSDMYAAYAARRPLVFSMGNHERETDEGSALLDFFHLPRNGPVSTTDELHYSFDWGDVHFVSVDTGSSLPDLAGVVRPWLLADLAATDKRWKVLFTHEPPLSLDPAGIDRVAPAVVREELLSAAIEGGVDLFLSGGAHSMQRHLPLTAENPLSWSSCPEGAGTTLVYAGTGAWFRAPNPPNTDPLTEPLAVYLLTRGLVEVEADAEEMVVRMISTTSTVIDEIRLRDCVDDGVCSCDDDDADGLVNAIDRCPAWPQSDPEQTDTSGDGIPDECQCGDATADGFVNSIDARIIQRCAVGLIDCPELCDVSGDGLCNSIDARLVQRFSVGLLDADALSCARRP